MNVTLDDTTMFDEQGLQIEVGSPKRVCIERAICGLDGLVSIDLGERAREIRQTGVLHVPSRAAMRARIESIGDFIDGQTHTLRTADGREYRNVRMDTFKQTAEHIGGLGVTLEYEIAYTQLGA